jgi:group I intron endonuclease
MQGIYCIENIQNNKKYYGSSMKVEKRLKQHRQDLEKRKHHNIYLQRAWNKNSDIFNFFLVEETNFSDEKSLLLHEQAYIDNNIDGYNLAPAGGGDTLSKHPNNKEIREKMKQSIQHRMSSYTPAERKKLFGKNGEKNGNWKNGGVSKKKCPKCNNNWISVTSKHCGDCRDRHGVNNSFFGRKHKVETIEYLSKVQKENSWIKGIDPKNLPYTKQYILIHPDGTRETCYGLKFIANKFGVSEQYIYATIKRCNQGKYPVRGSLGGYKIFDAENDDPHPAIKAPMAV